MFFSYSNKALLKKLLLDSGGLLLALQPLDCDDDDDDVGDDHPTEFRKLLSELCNSPHSGLTSQLRSLYFSFLTGCLSTLTVNIKTELDTKHINTVTTESFGKNGRASPPPNKKPRLADRCAYGVSNFDLLLRLDDGTCVPANSEAVAGVECEVGSEYFRGLLRGGFEEAQGKAEEAIHIKGVTTGMLVPVLHYLHGCRLTKDPDMSGERVEAGTGGQCEALGAMVFSGLTDCQTMTGEPSTENLEFQKTPLGEVMIGACRFLVTELQRELEDLCVSLLLSYSKKAAHQAAPTEDNNEKADMDQDCSEYAEENLASRTSELELTGFETQTQNLSGQTKKLQQTDSKKLPVTGSAYKVYRGLNTVTSDMSKIRSVTPVSKSVCSLVDKSVNPAELTLRPKNLVKTSTQDSYSSSEAGTALVALLPQVYWFSQRYSYSALGRACLSMLLGCQNCPRPFASSSLAGHCLRRLVREADCTEAVKQDLIGLVSVALS